MKKTSQLLFYVFSFIAFVFVVCYFSVIRTDIKLIGEVNIFWLCLSLIAQFATYLFSAMIYYRLLRAFQPSTRISIGRLYQASIVALFANQLIPFVGISGNIFFYDFLKREKISVQNIFTVVFVELLAFYAAIELIILAALAVCLSLYKISWLFIIILTGGFFVYIFFAFGITVIAKKETVNTLCMRLVRIKLFRKHADKLRKFVDENNNHLQNSLPAFIQHKRDVAPVIVLQACIFLVDIFTVYALFHGLGVSIDFAMVFIAFILTKIISLLPVSPGALIVYESSLTFFLTKLSAPLGTAVIVTLLFRILSFWLPMPVGFLLTGKLTHQRHIAG